MTDNPVPKRRPTRILGYDYRQSGAYFVTLCTFRRKQLFGRLVDQDIHLSPIGQIVKDRWLAIAVESSHVDLDFFTIMPDHIHALISFPPSGKPIKLIVGKWKEWTAKTLGIHWQRDFFEHRLRHDESRREKADYILHNPVRNKLVTRAEDWPFVYFADGQRPLFRQGQRFW